MTVETHTHDCAAHKVTMDNHAARLSKLEEILDKVRSRPPLWVTIVIGVLLALIGFLTSSAHGGRI